MIDLIIPAYNAHNTIVKALLSVALQTYREYITVYIVDDCSDESYDNEIQLFDGELNIKLIILDENRGPGYARQFAIDNSSSEYIVFLDSDDMFYNCYSIEILLNSIISTGFDGIQGTVIDENRDGTYKMYNDSNWSLHGKIYRRELLNKYNIKFNDSRKSEDDAFHKLFYIASNNIGALENPIYIYRNNSQSIVNSINEYWFYSQDDYINNMEWVFKNCEEKGLENFRCYVIAIEAIIFTYKVYNEYFERDDRDKLLFNVKKIYHYYCKYKDYFSKEEQNNFLIEFQEHIDVKISFDEYLEKVKNYC